MSGCARTALSLIRKWIMHPVQLLIIPKRGGWLPMTDLCVKPDPNYFRCTFAYRKKKKYFKILVQFRQGFVPIGHEMKKSFSLIGTSSKSRTLHARFDLFRILAICFGLSNFDGPTESAYAARGPRNLARTAAGMFASWSIE